MNKICSHDKIVYVSCPKQTIAGASEIKHTNSNQGNMIASVFALDMSIEFIIK